MAAFVELYMDQGATFSNIINIADDITNANINVSGYSVFSQMRRSYYSANASANLTCKITNASIGEITISMEANVTSNIKPGRYLFDVRVIATPNNTMRLIEGIITVTPSITK
jgi:hypothetical protein